MQGNGEWVAVKISKINMTMWVWKIDYRIEGVNYK
jgi:hypothetical protein